MSGAFPPLDCKAVKKILARLGFAPRPTRGTSHEQWVKYDAAGNLLVVDNWNHRVQRFAPNGTYLGQWGSPGSGPGLFLYPCGIAVAPDGTVVVTDNAQPHNEAGNVSRLMRFDASGAFLEEMRFPPIAGGPVQSLGVDIDSTGLVYVIQGDSVVVYDL